jgi:hypothetical protein
MNPKLMTKITELLDFYEKKEKVGIFFVLKEAEDPLSIIGVLDVLKYKIKKWQNTNIFSYVGDLFKKNRVLVIGSNNIEEAIDIILYVVLFNIVKKGEEMNNLLEILDLSKDLDKDLRGLILKDLKKGYPLNPDSEKKLNNHLKKLIL